MWEGFVSEKNGKALVRDGGVGAMFSKRHKGEKKLNAENAAQKKQLEPAFIGWKWGRDSLPVVSPLYFSNSRGKVLA